MNKILSTVFLTYESLQAQTHTLLILRWIDAMMTSFPRLERGAKAISRVFHVSLQFTQVSAVQAQLCAHSISVRGRSRAELFFHSLYLRHIRKLHCLMVNSWFFINESHFFRHICFYTSNLLLGGFQCLYIQLAVEYCFFNTLTWLFSCFLNFSVELTISSASPCLSSKLLTSLFFSSAITAQASV